MDIFPVAPLPQTEPTPKPSSPRAGKGDSEFDATLNQSISARRGERESAASRQRSESREQTTDTPVEKQKPTAADNRADNTVTADSGKEQTGPHTASEKTSQPEPTTPAALENNQAQPAEGSSPLVSPDFSITIFAATYKAQLALPEQSAQTGIDAGVRKQTVDGAVNQAAVPINDGESSTPATPLNNQSIRPQTGNLAHFESQFLSVTITNNQAGRAATADTASPEQPSLLLKQLNNLISQNNDKVTMTATFGSSVSRDLPGYMSSPLVARSSDGSAAVMAVNINPGIAAIPAVNPEAAGSQRTEVQLHPLRQEVQGNYLSSPVANDTDQQTENQDNFGSARQNNGSSQQAMNVPQSPGSSAPADSSGQTHGFSTQFQDASLQQAAEAAKHTPQSTAAHQAAVHEDDVINQVLQRFAVHSRLQTSRLSLKLHPAELGELKIDVLVKQDSLKANIFAQTQQAQEILERHLPRLRAMLEEHGMSIDDLIVTLESDSVDDFSQQNDQLFQEQLGDFREHGTRPDGLSFEQSFEETVLAAGEQHGVNLTV